MKLNIAAFLLAVPSLVLGQANLRGDTEAARQKEAGFGGPTDYDRELWGRTSRSSSYSQRLGQCRGALCGVWGDPHIITCDGMLYDCQGEGLFTLMKNHMWNIQGNFVDIGEEEHKLVAGWGLTHGATLTNDLVIEMFPDATDPEIKDKFPVVQIGYADLSRHDGTYYSEEGCVPWHTFDPVNMHGQKRSVMTLNECRQRCESTAGCTKFSWWADHGCHINQDTDVIVESNPKWSRALAGTLDSACGTPVNLPALEDDREDHYHGTVGAQCPMLLHIDGEMIDLSSFQTERNGYMYGQQGDDLTIKLVNNVRIEIEYEVAPGEYAAIHLFNRGHGPGELWSCHWNFHVCLPNFDKESFKAYGVGLLGSPDGKRNNDWMTPDNELIPVWSTDYGSGKHEMAFNYCVENWCVSQEDSKMVLSGDKTYNDIKCEAEEYKDFSVDSEDCQLAADKIIAACADEEPLLRYACELDCCEGGCDEMVENLQELTTLRGDLTDEEDAAQYGIPNHDECDESGFAKTPDSVCNGGDSANLVKLLKSSGELELPEDATLFYGLEMNVEPHDEMAGKAIRFRLNNFLEGTADMYVKHTKNVLNDFMDPVCDTMMSTAAGCDNGAPSIEVACHDYEGIPAFAIVQVYVQSREIGESDTAVDKCCTEREDAGVAAAEAGAGVAVFTFEIACDCPSTA